MAYGFNVVTIWVENKCSIVVRVIVRSDAGSAVVLTACGQRSLVEGIDGGPGRNTKSNVNGWLVCGATADPEVWLWGFSEAGDICVINKADLPAGDETAAALAEARALELEAHRICARETGDVAALEAALTARVVAALAAADALPWVVRSWYDEHGALRLPSVSAHTNVY